MKDIGSAEDIQSYRVEMLERAQEGMQEQGEVVGYSREGYWAGA